MSTKGPVFPVAFDELALAEDLARLESKVVNMMETKLIYLKPALFEQLEPTRCLTAADPAAGRPSGKKLVCKQTQHLWPDENEPSIPRGSWLIPAVERAQTQGKRLKIRTY